MTLLSFVWDIKPQIFPDTVIPVRWYGLMFAFAFLLGYEVLKKLYKQDNTPKDWLDKALYFTMVGTIIGARLGHVFFYDWSYYKNHLGEILKIWNGGLASHGAAIGIILALYFYSKYVTKKNILWALDRVVVTVALGAGFIRLGNFFNSEIIGKKTGTDFGVVFARVDEFARHPAQLYESFTYFVLFGFMYYAAFKLKWTNFKGRLFGLFLMALFTARFFIEFIKENQSAFEDTMTLNMGQNLSIPLVMVGLFFFIKSFKNLENVQQTA
jgi:prolipoprotein diacylglyceryl transferase